MNRTLQRNQRNGFTLIELLVVITIIILLVGIVLVVTSKALRAADTSATKFLMHTMSDGLEQFHTDFGYYPPLLQDNYSRDSPDRPVLEVQPNSGEELRRFRYFSTSSVPVYLLGVGRLEPSPMTDTGLDPDRHDGIAGPGIRDPGPDKSWGGALDRSQNNPTRSGRVYGPYVDLGGSDSVRPVSMRDIGNAATSPRFEGLSGNVDESQIDQTIPMIVDGWGNPIRYYRPGWLTRRPTTREFTLDYAPLELLNLETINGGFAPDKDPVISSAPFFLLSAGPNRRFTGLRPSPGGDSTVLSLDPMAINETNTQILDEVDNLPGELSKMLDMIGDNLRTTP